MKTLFKVLLGLLCVVAIAITFTIGWRPFLGPRKRALTDRHFESTPARLARGEYLVRSTLGCLECHSAHDWKAPGAPILAGQEGAGQIFPAQGLPGRLVASNITPDRETGAGNWSDDQLARAIREGIGHDGRTLFPLMPYENFRRLPDEDLAAVVVYLRSLPAVRNPLPETAIIFPVKYLIRSVPQPLNGPVAPPDRSTPARYGEYLVTIANCADCHTPMQRGKPIAGKELAGGQVFVGPWGTITSANITPDPSGISYYDEEMFMKALRTGRVGARALSPFMPWPAYARMSDDDLKAIFAYLRTVKPVSNRVDNSERGGQ